jgi:hypothetical protein
MHFRIPPPSEYAALLRGKMHANPLLAGLRSELNPDEVLFCEDILTHARTYFARAERVVA